MDTTPLLRFTRILLVVVAASGVISAAARTASPVGAEVAATRAEIIEPAEQVASVVAASAAPEQPEAPTTTTTAPPQTTTTTAPPPPPTTAPAPPSTTAPPAPPTTAPPAPAPAATSSSMSACEREMLDRMNGARSQRGIAALAGDDRIVPISRDWSSEMARRQDLQHNPDYAPRVFAARPEAVRAGENVGRTHGTNAGLFDAFMASPGHRDAILAPAHTHAGVGCLVDGGGQLWVTVNFWG
jgi:uncharacterized protein YkwD